MAILLLIDGYNVVAPIAAPLAAPGRTPDPMWLQRERSLLLRRLADHLSEEVRRRTCVVFDAANPPPDRPSEFEVDGIAVRFAIDHPEADDLLEEIIADHTAPKSLAVVSSDHRVQAAAKRRGCQPFESQPWLDDLIEGKVSLAVAPTGGAGEGSETRSDKPKIVDDDDVQRWLREFGF